MKKLLVLLLSILFLCPLSVFADDISDFQIEGISIGDSLLDYMTEDEILEWIETTKDHFNYLNEPNKYASVYLTIDVPIYDNLSFIVKNNSRSQYISNKNEKYKILSIRGMKNYVNDFDSCIQKRDKVAEELSNMFPNAAKEERIISHPHDPSGNSIGDEIFFSLNSGDIARTYCNDWEETFRIKNNYSEGLSVAIVSKVVWEWLSDQ